MKKEQMICKNCIFWLKTGAGLIGENEVIVGYCRRICPPAINENNKPLPESYWCGDGIWWEEFEDPHGYKQFRRNRWGDWERN